MAAGDFSDWLKSLGSDGKVNMDKDLIKKLFSIGIEDDAAKKALYVAPVIRSAIPEDIANIVRLPDVQMLITCLDKCKITFGVIIARNWEEIR